MRTEMDPNEVVNALYSEFILSESDKEAILAKPTREQQNSELIGVIMNRTSRGFDAFLRALADTGHDKAFHTVSETLDEEETISKLNTNVDTSSPSEFEDQEDSSSSRTTDTANDYSFQEQTMLEHIQARKIKQLQTNVAATVDGISRLNAEKWDLSGASIRQSKRIDQLCETLQKTEAELGRVQCQNITLRKDLQNLKEDSEKAMKDMEHLKEQIQRRESQANMSLLEQSETISNDEHAVITLFERIKRNEQQSVETIPILDRPSWFRVLRSPVRTVSAHGIRHGGGGDQGRCYVEESTLDPPRCREPTPSAWTDDQGDGHSARHGDVRTNHQELSHELDDDHYVPSITLRLQQLQTTDLAAAVVDDISRLQAENRDLFNAKISQSNQIDQLCETLQKKEAELGRLRYETSH